MKNWMRSKVCRATFMGLMTILLMTLVCVSGNAEQRKLKPGFNLFSKEQDVQLGKEAASQVEKQMQVVKNQDLENFINQIGRKLVARPEADSKSFAYSFKVVNEKSINAFALPGGPAFIHTGLITAADNEAQVAGVMAHEIAHVALRHGTNQASKANLIQLPAMLAGAVAGGSMLGQLAQLGVGLGANSVLLKFSRNAERDADLLGARMMSGAGYNPVEMARFFEKLETESGQRSSFEQFLSDHPNPGNRVKAVEEEIGYLPKRSYTKDSGQIQRMKQVISKLPPPPKTSKEATGSAAQQVPNLRPSTQLRTHQGQGFSVAYPDNWQVAGGQDTVEVTIAPQEGVIQSQDGNVAIGCGLILNIYQPERGQVNLQKETNELIRQFVQSNPGLQANSESRRSRVDGQEALVTSLSSPSPFQGETESDTLITVAAPQGLFYAILIAPASQTKNLDPAFQQMVQSIRFAR
jgi:beta-barrel assembly-enhancing protease